jgi:hypothetical protein
MTSYSEIQFMRSVRGGVVENQLPDVGAFSALVEVDARLIERLVDLQLQPHRLFGLVADAVVGAQLEAIVAIEFVEHCDALLVDPDAEGVANVVPHTRADTPRGGKPTVLEATA